MPSNKFNDFIQNNFKIKISQLKTNSEFFQKMVYVYSGKKCLLIDQNSVQKYLDKGWKIGDGKVTIIDRKTLKTSNIWIEDLNQILKENPNCCEYSKYLEIQRKTPGFRPKM